MILRKQLILTTGRPHYRKVIYARASPFESEAPLKGKQDFIVDSGGKNGRMELKIGKAKFSITYDAFSIIPVLLTTLY